MADVAVDNVGISSGRGRLRSSVVIAIAFALCAGSLSLAVAQSTPDPVVVDDVLTAGLPACEGQTADAVTIQEGVNQAKDDGPQAVVKVCPGIYPEYVVVDAPMTILGAQATEDGRGRSPLDSPEEEESFVTGGREGPTNGVPAGFFLTASNITIDGFYIGGFHETVLPGVSGAGIQTNPQTGHHLIQNDVFTQNDFGMNLHSSGGTVVIHNQFLENNTEGGASGTGIYSDQGFLNSTITENDFIRNDSQAIVLLEAPGPVAGINIALNRFEDNGRSVVLGMTDQVTIRSNVSDGTTEEGFVLEGGNVGTVIEGNQVSGSTSGLVFTDEYCCDAADAPDPINSGTRVRENDFAGNGNGIWVKEDSVTGATIRENHLRGNTTAIRTFGATTAANNPVITANRIFDNGAGVVNDSPTTMASAQNNWWGCNEGPSHADCDSAGPRVTFTPWIVMTLTSNKSSLARGESALITADMTKNSSGGTVTDSSLPDDTVIHFFTQKGSLSQTSVPIGPDGKATTVLTNNVLGGENKVSATLDNEVQQVSVFMAQPSPSPSPTPTPTATPSTAVSPTPTPTPTPSGSPTPTPTASTSASPTPTPTVSTSPSAPECSDELDNDGDGEIDYPNDPGCSEAADDFEDDELDGPPVLSGPCEGYDEGSRTDLASGGQVIVGSSGDDALEGTEGDDIICGLGGNDLISGLGGSDVIDGGTGDDSLRGGDGDDALDGDAGKDELRGNGGNDVLRGGDQNDDLRGNAGDDVMLGEGGFDVLRGGTGDDEGRGGSGNDTIQGFNGVDTLIGNSGNDTIKGAAGRDVLKGGKDDDVLSGGKHADRINGGSGRDVCAGGPGRDSVRRCEG